MNSGVMVALPLEEVAMVRSAPVVLYPPKIASLAEGLDVPIPRLPLPCRVNRVPVALPICRSGPEPNCRISMVEVEEEALIESRLYAT